MSEHVITNPDGSVTVALVFPIQGPDGQIAQITLRRPKGKDMRALKDGTEVQQTLFLISQLSQLAPPFVDELDVVDLEALGLVLRGFRQAGPATGAS